MVYYKVNVNNWPLVETVFKAVKIEYQPMNPDEVRNGSTDELEFRVFNCYNKQLDDIINGMPELGIEKGIADEPKVFPINWLHR
ncbi:MAG: hypothetical protein ABIB43_03570 [archaeon]